MTAEQTAGTRRVPWTLVVLGLVFFGPLAGAWLLFSNVDSWRPQSSHYGLLVTPVLTPDRYADRLPAVLAPAALRGHWTLLLVAGKPHDGTTARLLYDVRQLHVALGKHSGRVRRLAIADGALPALAAAPGGDRYYSELVVTAAELARLQAGLPGGPQAMVALYLVDPLGNLMMRYPLPVSPRGVLDDLRRLMRTSRLG